MGNNARRRLTCILASVRPIFIAISSLRRESREQKNHEIPKKQMNKRTIKVSSIGGREGGGGEN